MQPLGFCDDKILDCNHSHPTDFWSLRIQSLGSWSAVYKYDFLVFPMFEKLGYNHHKESYAYQACGHLNTIHFLLCIHIQGI